MAVRLPDELIVEILSILPAKSLLRCRLVCKSWLSLIKSTKFKLMHLHNFNQLNPRYFVRRVDCYMNKELYDVHFDDEAFTLDGGTLVEFPFNKSRVNLCYWIIGCCNGVVCLCDDGYAKSSLDMIILWNPSIRRKLSITHPNFYSKECEESYVILGFGYDKISDDYKVVCLTYVDCLNIRPQVEVYSVKTGIWREVMFPDNLPCFFILPHCSQIYSNGSVHWIASEPKPGLCPHKSILTFDISSEIFGEIQLPEAVSKELSITISMALSVVDESLAVIYSTDLNMLNLDVGSTYVVWVMKEEYTNPTSWTMIYCMHYPDIDTGKPLRLRNNGDMIVELENSDMIIFNHNEGYYVYVYSDGMEDDIDCRTYVDKYQESLALLDVGDSVPNEEAMKALMMIQKQEKLVKPSKNSPKILNGLD